MSVDIKLLALPLSVTIIACNRPLPCPDDECEDADDEPSAEDAGTKPFDLPCGGADLETDDLNCGACGNACETSYVDTPYGAGYCENSKCNPMLHQCYLLGEQVNTCDQLCAITGGTCVARGCPGVQNERITALLFMSMAGPCLPGAPAEERIQDCDEPIEYDPLNYWSAHCCCI